MSNNFVRLKFKHNWQSLTSKINDLIAINKRLYMSIFGIIMSE